MDQLPKRRSVEQIDKMNVSKLLAPDTHKHLYLKKIKQDNVRSAKKSTKGKPKPLRKKRIAPHPYENLSKKQVIVLRDFFGVSLARV